MTTTRSGAPDRHSASLDPDETLCTFSRGGLPYYKPFPFSILFFLRYRSGLGDGGASTRNPSFWALELYPRVPWTTPRHYLARFLLCCVRTTLRPYNNQLTYLPTDMDSPPAPVGLRHRPPPDSGMNSLCVYYPRLTTCGILVAHLLQENLHGYQ